LKIVLTQRTRLRRSKKRDYRSYGRADLQHWRIYPKRQKVNTTIHGDLLVAVLTAE